MTVVAGRGRMTPWAGVALRSIRDTATRILRHPANRGRRGRALALYVTWQVWQRVVRRPWTIRLGQHSRLRLHPHSVVAAFVLYYRVHDYEDLSFVRAYLRSGDLFVDVGANIGVYSLWAAETEGVEVLAFEPSSATHARAIENVELNRLGDRVRVLRKAVGAAPGDVRLTTHHEAINRVTADRSEASELVTQTTLDAELGPRAPALIKIDVEGGELDVLRGARASITRHRPALIVEVNDPQGLSTLLAELGYRAWAYDPEQRTLIPVTPALHTNVLALADVDDALVRVHTSARPAAGSAVPTSDLPPGPPVRHPALDRARRVLRQRGVRAAALGAVDEVRARAEQVHQRRRGPQTFVLFGVEHPQLLHLHNRTWRNERAIEIPLGLDFLARHRGPVLEVGNVLANYGRTGHVVVDRYEQRRGVLNVDIVDYEPDQRFGAIVALSTLEHVGWDEEPRDAGKIPRALDHLRDLLLPDGMLLVTCPLSYNPHLDELIAGGGLGPDRQAFLVRDSGNWTETDHHTASAAACMGRHGGTALWVAEFSPR